MTSNLGLETSQGRQPSSSLKPGVGPECVVPAHAGGPGGRTPIQPLTSSWHTCSAAETTVDGQALVWSWDWRTCAAQDQDGASGLSPRRRSPRAVLGRGSFEGHRDLLH